jgi:hypothetical protein
MIQKGKKKCYKCGSDVIEPVDQTKPETAAPPMPPVEPEVPEPEPIGPPVPPEDMQPGGIFNHGSRSYMFCGWGDHGEKVVRPVINDK